MFSDDLNAGPVINNGAVRKPLRCFLCIACRYIFPGFLPPQEVFNYVARMHFGNVQLVQQIDKIANFLLVKGNVLDNGIAFADAVGFMRSAIFSGYA